MSNSSSILDIPDDTNLSPQTLERILVAHAAHVARVRGGKRAELPFASLARARLSHRVLADADLSGAVLNGADLTYADFVGAVLYCADLRQVDGRYCDFSHADVRGAVLTGSDLSHAKLDYADFRPGRLVRQDRRGSGEIIDRSGNAANVDFRNCSLCGSSFEGAFLQGANFSGAIIHATRFKNAHLDKANFEGAVLSQVRLEELHLPDSVLKTCVIAPAIAEAAALRRRLTAVLEQHHSWVTSNGRSGAPAVLDGEDLRPLGRDLFKYQLTAVSARRTLAVAVNFAGMQLQGANFEDADLRGANFERTDLRGVKFRGAKLSHARFTGADVRSLLLKSGERLDFDIYRAEVTEEQLAGTRVQPPFTSR
jgi:uncharacterized protein YjbI with pentapeptide repeats